MSDFPDLSPDALGIQPLDLGGGATSEGTPMGDFLGSAPGYGSTLPGVVNGSAPAAQGGGKFGKLAPLLALLPIAMARGGTPAVAALMNGYQQAQQRSRQQTRQDTLDQQNQQEKQAALQEKQQTEQDRQTQLQNQKLTARTAFLRQAQQGLDTLDSPDQLDSYKNYLLTAGQPYGITQDDVNTIAASVTPTKLQQKAATKKLADIQKTYSDTERERLEQSNALFAIGDEKLTLPQIRSRAGGGAQDAQGAPMAVPTKPDALTSDQLRPAMVPDGKGGMKPGFAAWDPKQRKLVPVQSDVSPMPPQAVAYPQAAPPIGDVLDHRPDPATANVPDRATGLTPNALFQNGATWALTGRMPSMGMGSRPQVAAARSAIQNTGAALAASAGVDLPTLQAEYRANAGTLTRLLPQATATAGASNTANDNLQLALDQSPQVARTGSKLVNRYAQWFQGNLTQATGLTQFEVYIYTASREYAKVTSGGAASAAGLTDSAAREASALLNAAQSPEAFSAAVQAMQNDMTNVVKNQQKQLASVSSTIANFFGAVNGLGPVQADGRRAAPGSNPFRGR